MERKVTLRELLTARVVLAVCIRDRGRDGRRELQALRFHLL